MLPLLTLRTDDGAASTGAPTRRADGTVISTTDNDAIEFLIGLIEKGFVSLRPRASAGGGGYRVDFHMEILGKRRNNTAPTSEEPTLDTFRAYLPQLRDGSFGLQREGDRGLLFTTAQLSDRIKRAMGVRKAKVLKLMVNWIRGTGEFNAFGFFRDDINRRWLFDAFHTALNDAGAGEYLAILEDQYGFVEDAARIGIKWGHDRRWTRSDAQEGALAGPVLAAMLARQEMFNDEIKKQAGEAEALRQEQAARQAVDQAAASGREAQQRIEQAQMESIQANRARRQQMYDQAYAAGLDSVASEDVRWYNSKYITEQFETYFKRTTFASYMKDINALRGTYRVPLMDTPIEFPLKSWEAAAAAHAILATIANMCDRLKAEYQKQNRNPLTDADRVTVNVTLEDLRLPQLKGGSVKIYVRTIPSAAKKVNPRTAGALGGVSWTVYPKGDGKEVASTELYLKTASSGPIDSLRRLHIALNKIVTPLPSSSGHVDFNVPTSGWVVNSVQARPRVSQVAPVTPPVVDQDGFRSRRPRV